MTRTEPQIEPEPREPLAAAPATLSTARKATPREGTPREVGGREGPEPTRFGDWELRGRCIDF
ncbi:MAG: DUF1674 domain-containing protein [Steroidobacteraceae bacterium]